MFVVSLSVFPTQGFVVTSRLHWAVVVCPGEQYIQYPSASSQAATERLRLPEGKFLVVGEGR